MKRLILFLSTLTLLCVLSLHFYFTLVPPPDRTFNEPLAEAMPKQLPGWKTQDLEIADTPEASIRISEFLNFDDALFRVYLKRGTEIGLYIAYWSPGKASYRWAGAHTPDTCWIQSGWNCTHREYGVPFSHGEVRFQPAEFGVYETETNKQNVYFWHLVGGEAYAYKQKGMPNIYAALIDVKNHGLKLRKEQFFIRLSSNRTLDQLRRMEGFSEILDRLATIGLANETSQDGTTDTRLESRLKSGNVEH